MQHATQVGPGYFIFPLTQNSLVPAVGTGFDLASGQLLSLIALSGKTPLIEIETKGVQGQAFFVYDDQTFSEVVDFEMKAGGGGWGASVGMSASANLAISNEHLTFSLYYVGVRKDRQALVDPDATLEPNAISSLKTDPAKFLSDYGSHFVAGYIYGKSCKASYRLEFKRVDMLSTFAASYSESTSELGFSESMEASFQNTLKTSSISANITMPIDCIGFHASQPNSMDDLSKVVEEFNKNDPGDDSPIAIIVMPWAHLNSVQGLLYHLDCNDFDALTQYVNRLTYLKASADAFIGQELFAGGWQLGQIQQLATEMEKNLEAIEKTMVSAIRDGQPINVSSGEEFVVNGQSFAQVSSISQRLKVSMETFRLSFQCSVYQTPKLATDATLADGSPVPILNNQTFVDAGAGVLFTWSRQGNDSWEETLGSNSKLYTLAHAPETWNMAVILDLDAGTIQCIGRGYGQSVDQYPRSDTLVIRGNDNRLPCAEAAKSNKIVADLQGGHYVIAPM